MHDIRTSCSSTRSRARGPRRAVARRRGAAASGSSTVCTNGTGSSIDSQANGGAGGGGRLLTLSMRACGGGGGGGGGGSRGRSVRKEDVRPTLDRAKCERAMREAEMEELRDVGRGRSVRRSDVTIVSSSSSSAISSHSAVEGRKRATSGGGGTRVAAGGWGGETRKLLERGQRRADAGRSSPSSVRSASSVTRRRSVAAASRAAASTIASMEGSRRGGGSVGGDHDHDGESDDDDDRRRRGGSRSRPRPRTYLSKEWTSGGEEGGGGREDVIAKRAGGGGGPIERGIKDVPSLDGRDDDARKMRHPPPSISSSSSKIRHPIDKVQASLDVHHHRRGGRYRNHDGNRRGSAASSTGDGSGSSIRGGGGGGGGRARDDDEDGSGMGYGVSSRSTSRPRYGRGSTPGPSPSPSRSSLGGDDDGRRKAYKDVERRRKIYSRSPVGRDDGQGRQQQRPRRAVTPGPKTGGGAHRGMNAASSSNNSGEGVNRHQRMHSRSPTGSRQERANRCNPSDGYLSSDRSERSTSDYRSFSRGRPAASVHSVHSKRGSDRSVVSHRSSRGQKSQHALPAEVLPIEISIAPHETRRRASVDRTAASVHSVHSKRGADRSVVSHRSHMSQKSHHALPAKVLPIEISITPNGVRQSVNIETDATNAGRRSSSTGRRREDAGGHEAVDMNRVDSAVRMLNVMSLVDSTLKKVAAVSPAPSRRPSLANDKTPLKSRQNSLRPRSSSPITPRGHGNVEYLPEVSSQCSEASSSSSESTSSDDADAAASRNFLSSDGVQLDANGCCIYHPFVQLQRPIGGGGWRIMSRTCALCVQDEAEGSKKEIAAALASAAFKEVADKISNLKVGESIQRLKAIASTQSLSSTTSEGGGNDCSYGSHPSEQQHSMLKKTSPGRHEKFDVIHTSDNSLDGLGRGEDDESITPSCLESSSSTSDSESSSSDASDQSTSDDSEVLPDIQEFKFNYTPQSSTLKRSPPPPPPPRAINIAYNNGSDAYEKNVHNDISMAVLNPHPEPELQDEFPLTEITTQHQSFTPAVMNMSYPLRHPESFLDVQRQPNCQYQEAPEVGKSKDWMKYTIQASRREAAEDGTGNRKRSKFFGESRKKSGTDEHTKSRSVKQMPFTDQIGDFGYYTGQVDDEGRPNGKGVMKYENGVFYEGTWVNGGQDKNAASQYERIRGGFTSWSGKGKGGTKSGSTLPWNSRKNDAFDGREKTNVRGMDWTDLNGGSGRYTGEVDNDQLPHGRGVMRYDYGLIAEGEWVHGVLKEGPHDRIISAAAMNGRQSVAPGMLINSGMSVGPGAIGYAGGDISVLGAGGISVAPPVGFGRGMGLPVATPIHFRGMNASQHAMLAHQNAMMNMYGGVDGGLYGSGGGGSVYHGGNGSVYGGTGMVMPMQQMPPMPIQPMQHVALQQQNQQQQQNHRPPISNIVMK